MSFTLSQEEGEKFKVFQSAYDIFIPPDNDEMRIKYEATGKGGTCGPSCIAVLEHSNVQTIVEDWCGWRAPFRGFSPIGEMKTTLSFYKYQFK